MHNRIKELYDQVVGDDRLNFDSYLAEKFADLIIQECVAICMDNQFTGAENYNNGSVSSAQLIEEHFGLK